MKTGIHPNYYEQSQIRCSCGNVIVTGSTKESMRTELCSNCHPFYTGQQKLVDTTGRVDRFRAKVKAAELKKAAKKEAEMAKKAKRSEPSRNKKLTAKKSVNKK